MTAQSVGMVLPFLASAQQQKFYMRSGIFSLSQKSGRHDTRIIQNQAIMRPEILEQIPKMLMFYGPCLLIQYKKPRSRTIC